jgi:uncharacterized membrane protein
MPDIGVFHPQIVHFAIALACVGVLFRLVAFTGKAAFTGPAAATLLIGAGLFAWLGAISGEDAHGPVERIPGVRNAVVEHEDWGKRSRNILLIVAGLELVAIGLARRQRPREHKVALVLSAIGGLCGVFAIYETAEHGGAIVYEYAGGPGIRSGDTADVGRLLTAGLYNQAMLDRRQGKHVEAAALIDQLASRSPEDAGVQLLRVESLIQDRKDGPGALTALATVTVPADDARLRGRVGMLTVDAWEAAGRIDSARAVLERLIAAAPTNQRLKDRLERLTPATPQ